MISEVEKALYSFWSSFGIPAYEQAQVPNNAKLPYITYTVEDMGTFDSTILSAYVWAYDDKVDIKKRREILELIENAIPYGGTFLPLKNGNLWLHKNMISYGKDIDESNVIYGRVAYQVDYNHL